jgi:hypothetical protein
MQKVGFSHWTDQQLPLTEACCAVKFNVALKDKDTSLTRVLNL